MHDVLDVFESHYGLSGRPFPIAPDAEAVFWTTAHARAYAVLEYGVASHAPITLLTGAPGSGKTLLLQRLMEETADDVIFGCVSNARGADGELLDWAMYAFGLDLVPGEGFVAAIARLQAALIEHFAAGRRCVLVFDEAQTLSEASLEALRMLTNINSGGADLLQILLVGQPALRDRIRTPEMAQLAQRVGATAHLGPMDADTTARYVAHRLAAVGATRAVFAPEAVALIARLSGGVPRLVNQLCELSMVYGMADAAPAQSDDDGDAPAEISEAVVRRVVADDMLVVPIAPVPPPAAAAPDRPAGGPRPVASIQPAHAPQR